ncbi:MAG TPA: permease-like cell division protein FtsX, partial [Candidatus Eisenbacteria bacterium]|nr:permease-like cell division protein FtsX [Candidatus Eisenbacteria bacterium]
MKPRTLRYLMLEGARGIRRHRGLTFTAILTMTASLLVLGVFLVTSYNVRRAISSLESRKEVMVYLKDGLKPSDLKLFENRAKQHPAVQTLTFISREEAWQTFSQSMKLENLQEAVGGNPLPDAYRIELKPERRNAFTIDTLSNEFLGWQEVEEVFSGGEWVGRLDRFAHSVLLFTAAIGIAIGLSIIAIVSNTVRLTVVARQDLIHIMRVVGASEGFIRVPFLSEGVLQALIAALLALAGLWGTTQFVASRFGGV